MLLETFTASVWSDCTHALSQFKPKAFITIKFSLEVFWCLPGVNALTEMD